MAEHQLLISGVHYGANGDFVAGQKDTEETLVRTRELLSQIDRARPVVVLSPDPSNHIHRDAIQARSLGQRIGRVSRSQGDSPRVSICTPLFDESRLYGRRLLRKV